MSWAQPPHIRPASPTAPKVHVAPGPAARYNYASTGRAEISRMCPRGDRPPRRVTLYVGEVGGGRENCSLTWRILMGRFKD